MASEQAKTKKFQGGERTIPAPSQRAQKYYNAEEDSAKKQVRKSIRPYKPRSSLQPGTVLILLAGRFRGKRVILLKTLAQGLLLVTGPFKVNGVPLRRVNARYVIATKTTVDIKGVDSKTLEKVSGDAYFTREKKSEKKGEDAFFKQGEKPQVSHHVPLAKKPQSARVEDQKAVDKALLAGLKKEPFLLSYLSSTFTLRSGDRPHEMVF
ncbi:60S ribosomal protein L6 [Sphaceloma murrayae]|uniref:60S ribosomal protein L6 n=1 Tax=Sphaceloma murrayae TaxID=2082308 RepID=A0A2K1QVV1_9PEZI|nr:60S ribosomal protein L6 [Sphaceloma murrayae]